VIGERQKGSEEPAVYVDGERLRDAGYRIVDGQPQQIEHQPATVDPRPATVDDMPGSNFESLKISETGTPAHTGPRFDPAGSGQKKSDVYSTGPSVPGLFAGAAVGAGAHDNLSTTEKYLTWSGSGGGSRMSPKDWGSI
jgi:hypothetical protein